MIECTVCAGTANFCQGGLDTNGEDTESKSRICTNFIDIPRGLQNFSTEITVMRKVWSNSDEAYSITEYTGVKQCTAFFYDKSKNFIKSLNALNNIDFLQYLGVGYVRFVIYLKDSPELHPDDTEETGGNYYYLESFNSSGTAVQWYYSNDRLTHEDMPEAPEKAVKKPYPKALWRTDDDIPYHELFPVEKPCGAFMNAVRLEYVRIPESVRKIGRYAFFNTALRKVTIPPDCEYYETSFPENCNVEFYENIPENEEQIVNFL